MKSEPSILKKRVWAFTLDLGIITVANYFFTAAANKFIATVFFHFPVKFQMILIDKMEIFTSISLISLTFAYFSLFYFMTNGHTMGKTLFGLRVKNTDGSDLTLQQSMFRSLAYFTCVMTGSFLFALSFIRKDEKSLADVFSGTIVEAEEMMSSVGTEFNVVLMSEMNPASETPAEDYDQAA